MLYGTSTMISRHIEMEIMTYCFIQEAPFKKNKELLERLYPDIWVGYQKLKSDF